MDSSSAVDTGRLTLQRLRVEVECENKDDWRIRFSSRRAEVLLLTEAEVQRSFRKLFGSGGEITVESLDRGEELLEQLRPESPLRHRLSTELDELRRLTEAKA